MRDRTVLLFFFFTILFPNSVFATGRFNVLLICVDDLKPMLGCYGDTSVQSPNIDRLAARGSRFERAYCNQAVCSPSRNALLTGLRSQTLGIYDLATNFRVAAPDAVTLPQYFKSQGYRTESLGKIFHAGSGNHDDPASWSVPPWRAKAALYALDENVLGKGNRRKKENTAAKANNRPRGPAYESADVADTTYQDGQVAGEAIRRLKDALKSPDQPFFLAVGFVKPHLPFCAPNKYWDLYDPSKFALAERRKSPTGAPSFAATNWGELRSYLGIPKTGPMPDNIARTLIHGYHAATSYTDAQVGRVIDTLDEIGLAKNTIIVLWGDHGWHLGDHGMWSKHTNYEQAVHIPLIVVDPRTKGGTHSTALVESVDIYPTLCELAGLTVPAGLDGASFTTVVKDAAAPTKDAIFHVFPRGNLIGRAVRTPRYRLVEWKTPGAKTKAAVLELYDYESDPEETKNLVNEMPEVVQELGAILAGQPEAKPQVRAPKQAMEAKDAKTRKEKKATSNAPIRRVYRPLEAMLATDHLRRRCST